MSAGCPHFFGVLDWGRGGGGLEVKELNNNTNVTETQFLSFPHCINSSKCILTAVGAGVLSRSLFAVTVAYTRDDGEAGSARPVLVQS